VDGGPGHVVGGQLDLAGMEAAAHGDAEGPHRVQNRASAAYRSGGAIEGRVDNVGEHDRRQHPINLDLAARTGQELLDLADEAVEHFSFV
jgi:hypothetical protein